MSITVEDIVESVKELKAYNKNGELKTPVNEGVSMWWDGVFGKILDCLCEVQQLHAIGTVSEFRELKEKATAKKAVLRKGVYHCPSCGMAYAVITQGYCTFCGQHMN